MKILKYGLGALGLLSLIAIGVIFYVQSTSDGPVEPMQGGPFVTGEVVETPVEDWSLAQPIQWRSNWRGLLLPAWQAISCMKGRPT